VVAVAMNSESGMDSFTEVRPSKASSKRGPSSKSVPTWERSRDSWSNAVMSTGSA
jgi:hypothetical protein